VDGHAGRGAGGANSRAIFIARIKLIADAGRPASKQHHRKENVMTNAIWLTKSEEFNRVYAEWLRQNPNHSAPECEECGISLIGHNVIEGDYGWYCSHKCHSSVSEHMAAIPSDASDRRAERRQMGICW
jgi:hypothetical protein